MTRTRVRLERSQTLVVWGYVHIVCARERTISEIIDGGGKGGTSLGQLLYLVRERINLRDISGHFMPGCSDGWVVVFCLCISAQIRMKAPLCEVGLEPL